MVCVSGRSEYFPKFILYIWWWVLNAENNMPLIPQKWTFILIAYMSKYIDIYIKLQLMERLIY